MRNPVCCFFDLLAVVALVFRREGAVHCRLLRRLRCRLRFGREPQSRTLFVRVSLVGVVVVVVMEVAGRVVCESLLLFFFSRFPQSPVTRKVRMCLASEDLQINFRKRTVTEDFPPTPHMPVMMNIQRPRSISGIESAGRKVSERERTVGPWSGQCPVYSQTTNATSLKHFSVQQNCGFTHPCLEHPWSISSVLGMVTTSRVRCTWPETKPDKKIQTTEPPYPQSQNNIHVHIRIHIHLRVKNIRKRHSQDG